MGMPQEMRSAHASAWDLAPAAGTTAEVAGRAGVSVAVLGRGDCGEGVATGAGTARWAFASAGASTEASGATGWAFASAGAATDTSGATATACASAVAATGASGAALLGAAATPGAGGAAAALLGGTVRAPRISTIAAGKDGAARSIGRIWPGFLGATDEPFANWVPWVVGGLVATLAFGSVPACWRGFFTESLGRPWAPWIWPEGVSVSSAPELGSSPVAGSTPAEIIMASSSARSAFMSDCKTRLPPDETTRPDNELAPCPQVPARRAQE